MIGSPHQSQFTPPPPFYSPPPAAVLPVQPRSRIAKPTGYTPGTFSAVHLHPRPFRSTDRRNDRRMPAPALKLAPRVSSRHHLLFSPCRYPPLELVQHSQPELAVPLVRPLSRQDIGPKLLDVAAALPAGKEELRFHADLVREVDHAYLSGEIISPILNHQLAMENLSHFLTPRKPS